MRTTIEGRIGESSEPLSLEAEAAAWQSERSRRPHTVAGKVPVVRIRRRTQPASWPGSIDRAFAAAPR